MTDPTTYTPDQIEDQPTSPAGDQDDGREVADDQEDE
jgi:hypothetical protein